MSAVHFALSSAMRTREAFFILQGCGLVWILFRNKDKIQTFCKWSFWVILSLRFACPFRPSSDLGTVTPRADSVASVKVAILAR